MKKKVVLYGVLWLWLFLGAYPTWARLPTEEDYTILANYINTNNDLATLRTEKKWVEIAAYLNASPPSPAGDYWIWRTSVPATEYTGSDGIVWTEVGALTAAQARVFEWLTGQLTRTLDPTDVNVRQGIADTFGAGTTTRSNLLALGRRLATRAEALFTTGTGTGTTANPSITRLIVAVSANDVCYALGLCQLREGG